MSDRRSLLRISAWVVALAGLIDALVGRVWDLAAVLAVIVVVLGIDTLVLVRRPSIPLRADLCRWIDDRAAIESETREAIASRAVATYRRHLGGDRPASGGERNGPDASGER